MSTIMIFIVFVNKWAVKTKLPLFFFQNLFSLLSSSFSPATFSLSFFTPLSSSLFLSSSLLRPIVVPPFDRRPSPSSSSPSSLSHDLIFFFPDFKKFSDFFFQRKFLDFRWVFRFDHDLVQIGRPKPKF